VSPLWIPTPGNRRFRRARRALYAWIDELIEERRSRAAPDGDLLDRLIEAHGEGRLSRQELRANVCSFFLAGSDTSSAALTYTLYLLGRHPDVADRLRHSLDGVLDGGAFDPEAAVDLPPLRHALEEAMRLYPPGFSISREAREDYVLDGYAIPEGTQIFLPQWVVHRDPELFEDPLAYRPSRWEEREHPKYAHFPFGGGRRFCIGSHFAMTEMSIIVARLLRDVDFSMITERIRDVRPAATLRPAHPVEMRIDAVDL